MSTLLPGSTIGILGGGQLARMLILAGRNLGYRFAVFDPAENCSASSIADKTFHAEFSDHDTLAAFAESVDVVTLEFEGIPIETVEYLESRTLVRPKSQILAICQNRRKEKTFLKQNGFECTPFAVVNSAGDLKSAAEEIGLPAVLKTTCWGYDGKGQIKINAGDSNWEHIWTSLGSPEGILEKWVTFQSECSVVIARTPKGETSVFPVAENFHRNHILDISLAPGRLPTSIKDKAEFIATEIAHKLDLIGILAIEFFVTAEGQILVNEMAPRPHNSGHFSIDACHTSQFEQVIRAVCNLPLGPTQLKTPVAMLNLLGDLWQNKEPDWSTVLAEPACKLHLYDKGEARIGRKMGHINLLGKDVNHLFEQAQQLQATLKQGKAQ